MSTRGIRNKTKGGRTHSAIDMLLSSNCVDVSDGEVELTVCSSDIDVIMDGQGGICTKCNTGFKSRISLIDHVKQCFPDHIMVDHYYNNGGDDNNNNNNNTANTNNNCTSDYCRKPLIFNIVKSDGHFNSPLGIPLGTNTIRSDTCRSTNRLNIINNTSYDLV